LASATAVPGSGTSAEAPPAAGKAVAHIGSVDVMQQELDDELERANVPADKRNDQTLKAALIQVVTRKYVAQQALAAKLDRDPRVQRALQRARDQVLADAYAQRDLKTQASAISKVEVDSYIHAHPAQFAARRLFQIEQISFPPQKDMDSITSATKDFKSLDQVAAKLNEAGIKFNRGTAMVDGGTVPLELLNQLDKRKPDDLFLVRNRGGATYFKVNSVEEKPLTGDDAAKVAMQRLGADLARKIALQSVDAALASAKFEGDYGRIVATPTPTNEQTPESPDARPGEPRMGDEKASGKN
jgi:EpsD family peptidyl-prolyl cis-trans isomerase